MELENLTIDAKARLFDQLLGHEPHLTDGLLLLARDKARALITIHESGLKPGGRAYGPADFGLPEISAAYEILHGESLHLDALIEEERLKLEQRLIAPGDDGVVDESEQG